ncbi:MAG: maleylpyruvate isomerase family mycothiol-dependent enzyme [Mycolicibacterium rufum]|nr:maleylpyruvate isomerase family mycothiol-dependent enzyme [Mycolicibacterium rufum]
MMSMAHAERADLAEFLASLTAAQWYAPSLCERWSVKDVVAHVISYDDLGAAGLMKRLARGRIVHANQVGVDALAAMSPQQLLEIFKDRLHPRGLTAGFGGMIALVDGTVHHQDIRRPLGCPRAVPVERLRRILPLVPANPRLGAWRRIHGLRLSATNLDWTYGKGPEVTGTGEALLLAMAGRSSVLPELGGAGQAVLAKRLQRR